jgi:hypothetical protein
VVTSLAPGEIFHFFCRISPPSTAFCVQNPLVCGQRPSLQIDTLFVTAGVAENNSVILVSSRRAKSIFRRSVSHGQLVDSQLAPARVHRTFEMHIYPAAAYI